MRINFTIRKNNIIQAFSKVFKENELARYTSIKIRSIRLHIHVSNLSIVNTFEIYKFL